MSEKGRVLGGTLLVAGTTIGVAMLVLPVSTGLMGFIPAVTMLAAFWCFMTFSAFCFLEVNLWVSGDTDIISMARLTLGPWGERFCWGAYMFLLYALTTAYLALSAPLFTDFFRAALGVELPQIAGPLPILFVFAWILYRGPQSADMFNRCLMTGLVIAYVALSFMIAPHVDIDLLANADWSYAGTGLAVIATAFGYHIIIPSLTNYMGRDVPKLKLVLILGGLAPLLINAVWEAWALGVIPMEGLRQGYVDGVSSSQLLRESLANPGIGYAARLFSFFAITTSFLGVSLSLFHFLADGLQTKKTIRGRVTLSGLTFIPPLFIVWMYPRASLTALEYAGVVGVVILLGLMPVLMVWSGRYYRKLPGHGFRVFGGKFSLVLAITFALAVVAWEIALRLECYQCL